MNLNINKIFAAYTFILGYRCRDLLVKERFPNLKEDELQEKLDEESSWKKKNQICVAEKDHRKKIVDYFLCHLCTLARTNSYRNVFTKREYGEQNSLEKAWSVQGVGTALGVWVFMEKLVLSFEMENMGKGRMWWDPNNKLRMRLWKVSGLPSSDDNFENTSEPNSNFWSI